MVLKKKSTKIVKTPTDAIPLTVDVVAPVLSILHKERLEALRKKSEEESSSKIPPNNLIKLANLVLKRNILIP